MHPAPLHSPHGIASSAAGYFTYRFLSDINLQPHRTVVRTHHFFINKSVLHLLFQAVRYHKVVNSPSGIFFRAP